MNLLTSYSPITSNTNLTPGKWVLYKANNSVYFGMITEVTRLTLKANILLYDYNTDHYYIVPIESNKVLFQLTSQADDYLEAYLEALLEQ